MASDHGARPQTKGAERPATPGLEPFRSPSQRRADPGGFDTPRREPAPHHGSQRFTAPDRRPKVPQPPDDGHRQIPLPGGDAGQPGGERLRDRDRGGATGAEPGIGPFDIRYVPLAHSIAEGNALVIDTPHGRIFHTGDWKLDDEPLIGVPATAEELTEIGNEGVLALVCDSTNVFNPKASGSEGGVRDGLLKMVEGLAGRRVVVTTFASNVARLQTLGEVIATAVEPVKHRHAVGVGILAGEERGPAGRADRVGDERVGEPGAAGCKAVEVGRLVHL